MNHHTEEGRRAGTMSTEATLRRAFEVRDDGGLPKRQSNLRLGERGAGLGVCEAIAHDIGEGNEAMG